MNVHDSDCAIHNPPALPPGPCDCGVTAPLSDHFAMRNPTLEEQHQALIKFLTSLRVPRIVGEADGHDLRNLADHAIEVAQAVDAYMRAIGREAAANAVGFEEELFDNPLFGALDGQGLHELHRHAEIIDEEMEAA